MSRKCYISFKTEDSEYKKYIQDNSTLSMIDKSLNTPINSEDEDYIMRMIRQDYLSDSTVTIFLIGQYSAESLGTYEQRFIKRELQASLFHGRYNTQNGILGIVLPQMMSSIYGGDYSCITCGGSHNTVRINNSTVISEFGYNYYIPNGKCAWSEDDRFCVLVPWESFISNPEHYIEKAFNKRAMDIAEKTKVRP
jgi:hypothetical protein